MNPLKLDLIASRLAGAEIEDLENVPVLEELTCFNCPVNKDCEFAFDLYNTDGDCLALK